jgi:hypothetical protein
LVFVGRDVVGRVRPLGDVVDVLRAAALVVRDVVRRTLGVGPDVDGRVRVVRRIPVVTRRGRGVDRVAVELEQPLVVDGERGAAIANEKYCNRRDNTKSAVQVRVNPLLVRALMKAQIPRDAMSRTSRSPR